LRAVRRAVGARRPRAAAAGARGEAAACRIVSRAGSLGVIELHDRLQSALGDAYRIERELGGGGMSRVFLAGEVRLGRQVVVQVLPPEMAAGVNVERFEREIRLAAKSEEHTSELQSR